MVERRKRGHFTKKPVAGTNHNFYGKTPLSLVARSLKGNSGKERRSRKLVIYDRQRMVSKLGAT